mmetsp:Transcript_42276/g.57701  ORF Transcript_42276/g.57701 Transcript_42276/m.57701 type:complete len:112 (-) Transcript_42276:115-450(-)
MHCCGGLSVRAVEVFEGLSADAVLLMPCCLPPKPKPKDGGTVASAFAFADTPPEVYATTEQAEQHARWAEVLRKRVAVAGTSDAGCPVVATMEVIGAVLSARNSLICGVCA